jgi:hypothetical protein
MDSESVGALCKTGSRVQAYDVRGSGRPYHEWRERRQARGAQVPRADRGAPGGPGTALADRGTAVRRYRIAAARERGGTGRGRDHPPELRDYLRFGVTTIRVTGSQGLLPQQARQAMRYGAFRGPRLLTCGRIISATAPGGRFYGDMYREADGPDDVRRAVREQIRAGADFVNVMTTGRARGRPAAHQPGPRGPAHAAGSACRAQASRHGRLGAQPASPVSLPSSSPRCTGRCARSRSGTPR